MQFLFHLMLLNSLVCKIPIILNQNGVFYPGWFKGDWETKTN